MTRVTTKLQAQISQVAKALLTIEARYLDLLNKVSFNEKQLKDKSGLSEVRLSS